MIFYRRKNTNKVNLGLNLFLAYLRSEVSALLAAGELIAYFYKTHFVEAQAQNA